MNLLSLKPYIYDFRNETELDGAALISRPGTLKQMHEQLDGDFYILPCSVEQVLIVPKLTCEMELEDLEKFVKDMCDREVPLQNQLSSQIYEFDGTALKLAGDNLTVEKDNLSNASRIHLYLNQTQNQLNKDESGFKISKQFNPKHTKNFTLWWSRTERIWQSLGH